MSPIRAGDLARYPANWRAISDTIRFTRAAGRCECAGECGHRHPTGRCDAAHLDRHPVTRSVVVLTVAHLDHTPENSDPANLRAMCQRCHLAYDRELHATNTARTRAAGMEPLFHLD